MLKIYGYEQSINRAQGALGVRGNRRALRANRLGWQVCCHFRAVVSRFESSRHGAGARRSWRRGVGVECDRSIPRFQPRPR